MRTTGLDSYLYAKENDGSTDVYRSESEIASMPEEQRQWSVDWFELPFPRPGSWYHADGVVQAAYWRKVNAVHGWFVDNVQNGVDECKPHFVSREQLQALVDECRRALDQRDPGSHLQPRSGFFFGGTELDEWYWRGLEETVDMVSKALADPSLADKVFVYQSSW